MKKLLITTFIFLNFVALAQENKDNGKEKSKFWENVHFGGGIQLGLGSGYTTIGVSPSAIYSFNDHWSAGVGTSYTFSKISNSHYHIFGGSAMVFYQPIKEIQLHTEFENLWVNTNNVSLSDYSVPAWYIGAGYSIGRNGSVGLRYDLLWNKEKSVYNNALSPYFKIYF